MEIIFTKGALNNLKEIQTYIYKYNRSAAKKVHAHIIEKIETMLSQNPAIGRLGQNLRTRELIITKYPYVVPYQMRDGVIYILRVLHTSRKWES